MTRKTPAYPGPYCDGPRKHGQGPCTQKAGWGTPHPGIGRCKLHGGCLPGPVAAAQRAAAREMANLYGIPRHVDPADGLIEEYWRTAGIVAGLEQLVAGIPQDDLVFGVSEVKQTEPDESTEPSEGGSAPVREVKRRAAPNVWLKLFTEERDRYAKLGIEIVRLGLEARRDEYIRAQVEVFAGVLQAPELDLSPEQLVVAARLLRALGAQPRMIDAEEVKEHDQRRAEEPDNESLH